MTNPRDELMALAPCPFCHGTAYLHEQEGQRPEDTRYSIHCDECEATHCTPSKDAAVAAWNRRATSRPATQQTTSRLGAWLAAALDDPNVCAEMKADIEAWMNAGEPAYDHATQVVDREAVARALCESGKFETGEGTCSLLCMDQLGSVRKNGPCSHLTRVHGNLADTILSLLRPAEPVEAWNPVTSPGMTDLMVPPESLDAFMEANPLPTPDAVGEPVAWRVLITKNAKTYNEYTERLPFEPLEDSGVVVRCEPEPLYTHPPKSPDISAEEMRDACELVAINEKNENIRATNEAIGLIETATRAARAFTASKIAAAIRQLPTSERGE